MRPILAIDPGKQGGIVYVSSEGAVDCHSMPKTEGDVLSLLRELVASGPQPEAVLESVHGFPGMQGQFAFGEGFGFIKGETGQEYFFHQSAIYGEGIADLREGDGVEFEVTDSPKGPRAESVKRTTT